MYLISSDKKGDVRRLSHSASILDSCHKSLSSINSVARARAIDPSWILKDLLKMKKPDSNLERDNTVVYLGIRPSHFPVIFRCKGGGDSRTTLISCVPTSDWCSEEANSWKLEFKKILITEGKGSNSEAETFSHGFHSHPQGLPEFSRTDAKIQKLSME